MATKHLMLALNEVPEEDWRYTSASGHAEQKFRGSFLFWLYIHCGNNLGNDKIIFENETLSAKGLTTLMG